MAFSCARGTLRLYRGLALAILLAMALPWVAFADDIANTLDATVDADLEVLNLSVGGSFAVTFTYSVTNDDSKNGCNLTGQGAQLVASVASSDTDVATVSQATVTFTSCGSKPFVTVTAVGNGTATVTLAYASHVSGHSVSSADFNFAPASFTVNVGGGGGGVDPQDLPQIFVPGNITVPATSAAGAAVAFSVTAEDGLGDPLTPVCTPASGSTFPIGTTPVNCSATDGNNPVQGSFTVTVIDGFSACLYAGSLSQVRAIYSPYPLKCGRGTAITLLAGTDFHACLYAGSLSQVGTQVPSNCGRGAHIGLSAGEDYYAVLYAGSLSRVGTTAPFLWNWMRGTLVGLAGAPATQP
jgi:hypothetical protein